MSVSPILISDIIPRTQIIATASQTQFDCDWTADATTDIVVYRRAEDEDADDQTQEVSTDDYNVTFVGDGADVRVTFLSGVDLNDVITIVRNTPADRTNLYTNTNFTPSMLNEDFGILTLVDQQAQLYDQQSAPHYNLSCTFTDESDKAIDMILPILGADQIWVKNGANTAITAVTLPGGGGLPSTAPAVIYTADPTLTDAQDIGLLSDGLLQISVTSASATISSTISPSLASIKDVNDNNSVEFFATPSAVNYLRIGNAPTGSPTILASVGTDTNIGFQVNAKGTGPFAFFSAATANQTTWYSGTAYQSVLNWNMPNSSQNITVSTRTTSGTMAYLTDIPAATNGFTSQNVVTGSRALNTVYQNTAGKTMMVTVSVGNGGAGVGTTTIYTDSSNPPVTPVSENRNPPAATGGTIPNTFMVLNNNYYKVASDSTPLLYWTEWV